MVKTRSKISKTLNAPGALVGSNDDLLTEILLRLPVTSILRFKSVSKHWHSLLSHSHLTQSSHRGSLESRKYFVFNPTTKQFAVIPSLHGGLKARQSILHIGLAFHPTDCVHYKLVCIHQVKDLLQVQIYSSDTGKWNICPVTFHSSWLFFQQQRVYWNGAFYWAPSYHNHLYFKIEDEQLQTLPLPLEMAASISSRTTMYFGESRGHLHLIVDVDYPETSLNTLNVHEMLSNHSGWFVKYQIHLPELWDAFPEMTVSPYDFKVVDVVRGEKEEDTFMVLIIPRIFIRC
ncbi:putative F-box domain-containing protein [Helianthus anomalus]